MEWFVFLKYALFTINKLLITQICVLLTEYYFGNWFCVYTNTLDVLWYILWIFVFDVGLKENQDIFKATILTPTKLSSFLIIKQWK